MITKVRGLPEFRPHYTGRRGADTETEIKTRYQITLSAVNGSSYNVYGVEGGALDVIITPNDGYMLPSTVTVVGTVSHTYDSATGRVSLTNIQSTVTILTTCPVIVTYFGAKLGQAVVGYMILGED